MANADQNTVSKQESKEQVRGQGMLNAQSLSGGLQGCGRAPMGPPPPTQRQPPGNHCQEHSKQEKTWRKVSV